ncbi:pirin family protein [Paenibacillus dokdonensis]|uniref:Pirin family protein n=1 Tax=Paenibacillus dokdonensis TaxID=2567944 RepID=A0ABU6GKZ7_9BACL|nr:pirin family protein [Paenibacillus dokdonensis]MEC0240390.1 pirin family protein [Paenibacillus dokdonensis]
MKMRLYTPAMQGKGIFDGGKITEQKPIGFPGEGSVINRVGPLFYWAWAHTPEEGYIPLHPHYSFEIMTYVLKGRAEHGDSLGTRSTVGEGGAQVIKAGSGVSHEERFLGPDMEAFQIWFEPDLQSEAKKKPVYAQYEHDEFPIEEQEGLRVKQVLGDASPIHLTAEARMWDIELMPQQKFSQTLTKGKALAALAVRGGGSWKSGEGHHEAFHERDFMLLSTDEDEAVLLQAGEESVRIFLIEVPERVNYGLIPKKY